MYFKLLSDLSLQAGYIVLKGNENISLITGAIVDEEKVTSSPWPYTLEPDMEEGLLMSDFYRGDSLMSNRLIATLRDAGVRNFQVFPAAITNTESQEVRSDYSAVNIIGLVSCADEDTSESTPLATKQFFLKLVIDPSRAHDLLVFRLAESPMEILVHERVAKVIEAGNFVDVKLEPIDAA